MKRILFLAALIASPALAGNNQPPAPPTIVDAKGKFVGYAMQAHGAAVGSDTAGVYIRINGAWGTAAIRLDGKTFASSGSLYYKTSDCTGKPYLMASNPTFVKPTAIGNISGARR